MEERTCRCGHGRRHPMVSAEAVHGVLGYFRLMIGGTPTPKKVNFRCRKCGQLFDSTEDPTERAQLL